ncbi:MAG: hypothetical protein J5I93_24290 [Pirellulaceae bacterium]|nr:hypothetical protein [Pirellulaceae bacterium]
MPPTTAAPPLNSPGRSSASPRRAGISPASPTLWLLLGCGLLAAGGCSLLPDKGGSSEQAPSRTASQPGTQSVKLSYQSDSGRLNLLTASQLPAQPRPDHRQVGFQQPTNAGIPPFAQCRLSLVAPHPQGKTGYALAVLTVLPDSVARDHSMFESVRSQVVGGGSEPGTFHSALEVWTTDVPQWQVEQLLTRLREADFFRRQRSFQTEVHLWTEIDGTSFGKPTAPIAELDALILRVRHEGRLVRRSTPTAPESWQQPLPELVRLPPVGRAG